MLLITIPEKPPFYSLYAQGIFDWKSFDRMNAQTVLAYAENAAVVLYYTYPTYREASVIRNSGGNIMLPGLSKKITVLFSVRASRVDKLRRAIDFLNKNTPGGAYSFGDGFYIRLYFLLLQRGKINYPALRRLSQFTQNGQKEN
jgi:hypothetical protein